MDRSHLAWPFFSDSHRKFATDLDAWLRGCHFERGDAREIDPDVMAASWVRKLGTAGWLCYCVPKDYGGALEALDVRTLCLARERLAYEGALADFAFAMQGLGSGPLTLFGSRKIKQRYLPAVASGEAIAAFALSEREAGSDVAAVSMRAAREGDTYVLDGEKTWISNASIASYFVVFARTGDSGAKGLSAFAVDASAPGLRVTEKIDTLAAHPLGSLRFDACRVPGSARIGEEGEGFKIAMATLDVFRATVAAAALGFARRALAEAVVYARERRVFGAPLARMQITQAKIAQMATAIDAAALLVYRAAWKKDDGAQRVTRESAMAKLFATEEACTIIDAAVQIFGGRGVRRGEVVESLYRDARALRIYEGASEIQQLVIARSILEGK